MNIPGSLTVLLALATDEDVARAVARAEAAMRRFNRTQEICAAIMIVFAVIVLTTGITVVCWAWWEDRTIMRSSRR